MENDLLRIKVEQEKLVLEKLQEEKRVKAEQEKLVLEKLREENRATAERNKQLERARAKRIKHEEIVREREAIAMEIELETKRTKAKYLQLKLEQEEGSAVYLEKSKDWTKYLEEHFRTISQGWKERLGKEEN